MIKGLSVVTIPVRDQDEALRFYTEKLGLEKLDDLYLGEHRWLTVTGKQQKELQIFLMPTSEENMDTVGKLPMWAFNSDDCRADYELLRERGVKFAQEPQQKPWGIEAILEDLYGNKFALVQPSA